MKPRTLGPALAAITIAMIGASAIPSAAAAGDPTILLKVDVQEEGKDKPNVKITLPLSLMEIVVDNVEPMHILGEIKDEKGIDLAKMWRQVRDMDGDEFVTIDADDAKIKVFKERNVFRISARKGDAEGHNAEVRIPFAVMDFLFKERKGEFRFSELVDALRGELPLTVLEADHDGKSVKIWLEEK